MFIALLGGLLVIQQGSGSAVIPLLGALALGAQRLLPALQQIYNGWAMLNGYNSALSGVVGMLEQPLPTNIKSTGRITLSNFFQLQNVSFSYAYNETLF